jgi:pyruvate,water dikinase
LAAVVAKSGADSPESQRALGDFLDNFGHFSDSGNDFSIAPWREQPHTVVKMAAGRTVRDRAANLTPWASVEQALPLWHRPLANGLRKQARTFVQHREAVSSTYTYGYGLFRNYFLEIGRRLVARDLLGAPDDVMYLSYEEVQRAMAGADPFDYAFLVAGRKQEIAAVAEIDLPEVIYGDDFIPRPADDAAATSWHGTPTARGHHRGPVRVVNGMADFDKVDDGDVLAIPYSDVGWTPLFAKAGAVVAESGGMLSHSSIVAREYGIPCVVSVVGAMRIPDGAIVTVDGYRGVVVLETPA